jgi:hypothetical protein
VTREDLRSRHRVRAVNDDEFRVEVELDDEDHGYSLRERLRALDLDDEARERLGRNVIVSRDGSTLFLYAAREEHAREAERVVRELIDAEGLSAEVAVTRWHPIEEEWKDASLPLPRSEDEREAEYARREAAEAQEAEAEGEFDWHVVAHLPGRSQAAELAERLSASGIPVARRWRYVVAGAVTEERAEELAEQIRAESPPETEVWVEVNTSDLALPTLLFLPA